MNNSLTISSLSMAKRLRLAFGMLILFLFGLAGFAAQRMQGLQQSMNTLSQEMLPKLASTHDWIIVVHEATGHMSTALVLADAEGVQRELAAIARNADTQKKMRESLLSMSVNEAESALRVQTIQAAERYRSAAVAFTQRAETGDLKGARSLMISEVQPAMTEFTGSLRAYSDLVEREVNENSARSAENLSNALWLLTLVSVVILATSLVVANAIARSILGQLGGEPSQAMAIARDIATGDFQAVVNVREGDTSSLLASLKKMRDQLRSRGRRVQDAAGQVASASAQLSSSAKEMDTTINEQVASTNEVVASARQISATAQTLVETMGEVALLSTEAAEAAGLGQQGLTRMSGTMQQIEVASGDIGQKLAAINAKVANITSVVTTINKVADQTNLLSLNAAIEAAKAGEFGQGFAVVAREIRRLADQTAVATLDIEQMVKEMQSSVAAGVMGMEKFAHEVQVAVRETRTVDQQIGSVIGQVQSLGTRFESVNEGMESQSIGARQISEAMMQLSDSTRRTAQLQHEAAVAIEQLEQAARVLAGEVSAFKVKDVGAAPSAGSRTTTAPAAPSRATN